MTLRLAKLQNLLWQCSFTTAQFTHSKCRRTSDTAHACMVWRTAYFNYGISGLCKDKYLCKVLVKCNITNFKLCWY